MYIVEDEWRHTFMKLDDARKFAMDSLNQEFKQPSVIGPAGSSAHTVLLITRHNFSKNTDEKVGTVTWKICGRYPSKRGPRRGNAKWGLYWHSIINGKDYPLNKDGSLARSWSAFYKG